MNKRERVQTVVDGNKPDRPPVSFWYHFAPDKVAGQAAVDAHLGHLAKYDLDFLKVMDDNRYPRDLGPSIIESIGDLKKLQVLRGTESSFAAQLDVLRKLKQHLERKVFFCTTLFNPWATLRTFVEPPSDEHGPPKMDGCDARDDKITELLKQDRAAVAAAIDTLAESIANYARECIRAGADGVFLSVRDDWVDRRENGEGLYDEIVKPADLKILAAASAGTFNVLHICGRPLNFERFAGYPVHVLNWADRAAGPSIAYARDRAKPALSGGIDNLKELPEGTPAQVRAQALDAVRQAGHRPILLTPGCTYDPTAVSDDNLHAMVDAAKSAAY
jgi:uroporphyrinogen decarboxylase